MQEMTQIDARSHQITQYLRLSYCPPAACKIHSGTIENSEGHNMDITPEQLRLTRKRLGLTAKAAGASIHVSDRTWQGYEAPANLASYRAIPLGLLELFCIKHSLPFPPLRQDGTLIVGNASVISFISATGGCGKTSITFELARLLAKCGQRTAVITDSGNCSQDHFNFQNPKVFNEENISLSNHELRAMQVKLRDNGVIDEKNIIRTTGVEHLLYGDEIRRLKSKTAPVASLQEITAENDFVFFDISTDGDIPLLVSDVLIYVLDLSRSFAVNSASRLLKSISRKLESESNPKLFCLLVNKSRPPYTAESDGNQLRDIGTRILKCSLSKSYADDMKACRWQSKKDSNISASIQLLADAAPGSATALEYRRLANELLCQTGIAIEIQG